MAWLKVCKSEEVVAGALRVVRVGIRPVALTRVGGQLVAFKNSCPHAASPLSGGEFTRETVTCPRHGWTFSLTTGRCEAHEGYGLRFFEVREADGLVQVAEPEEIW